MANYDNKQNLLFATTEVPVAPADGVTQLIYLIHLPPAFLLMGTQSNSYCSPPFYLGEPRNGTLYYRKIKDFGLIAIPFKILSHIWAFKYTELDPSSLFTQSFQILFLNICPIGLWGGLSH